MKTHFIHDRIEFESFDEFLETVSEPLSDTCREAWTDSDGELSSEDGALSFTGTLNFEHALQLAREGWPEGLVEFDDKMREVAPHVEAAGREPAIDFDRAGYAPNVAMFCAGDPACMYTQGESYQGTTPIVRVLLNITVSGMIPASILANRGAALAAVIEYMESAGFSVEVTLYQGAEAEGWRKKGGTNQRVRVLHEHFIPVKRAGEFIEPDRFAFMLAHPSVLRRFIFRLDEMCAESGPHMRNGYGTPTDADPEADQIYFQAMRGFSSGARGYATTEEALKTVLRHFREAMDEKQRIRLDDDWSAILNDDTGARW